MNIIKAITTFILALVCAHAYGQWTYRSTQDELRGTTNYTAILMSEDRAGALAVRSRNNNIEVFVTVNRGGILDYDTRSNQIRVSYRIDGGPIESLNGNSSSNRTAVFFPSPTQFVTRLYGASRMVIELPMFRRSDIQLAFDLSGFSPEKVGMQPAQPPNKAAPEKQE